MLSRQPPIAYRTLCWVACAVALACCSSGACGERASPEPLLAALKIPAQHPYLLLTREEIAQVGQLAQQQPWAKATIDETLSRARQAAAKPFVPLPPKGDTAHWQVARRLVEIGLGHALSGGRELAEAVRDVLLAYAQLYPTLPMTRQRCKVFSQSSLYEAMWARDIVMAYDLVADSGVFSAEQRRRIEVDLIRPAVGCFLVTDYDHDPRIQDLHYRCYNFQAWHLGTIGLAGLVLRDTRLIDSALNGRYGLKHLLAHDVCDDGLFWERSVGYHHFVIAALLPFTEAMFRSGVDLYRLEVPPARTPEPACRYVTDTSSAAKSFRMMFQAPFYLAFPDLSYPALGDSDRGPLRPDPTCLIAWNRFRDPHLAWMLRSEMGRPARAGFLHYYRFQYRYDDVQLDGHPIRWGHTDPAYRLEGNSVFAGDGDVSQSDRYLLNDSDLGDFVLQWNMTRLKNLGRDDRAWVVFQTNPQNPRQRRTFMLTDHLPEIGRSYRFHLEVHSDRAELSRDGKFVSNKPMDCYASADWQRLIYEMPSQEPAQVDLDQQATWQDRTFAATGVFRNGCSLLPSSGIAVLRQKAGDFTADRQATAAALSYGPYGGGHGHPDKLGLVVYALGRQWVPHYGSMPYETHWKKEWTAHSVSHNTLVVDEVSQQPSGKVDQMWPVDSLQSPVIGVLERFDPQTRAVAAHCDSAYPGLTLRREVRLRASAVVDRFQAAAAAAASPDHAASHQFDYVLHVDGTFQESSVPLRPQRMALGSKCGYQLVEKLASATIDKPASLTFASGAQRLRIWAVPQGPLELILAQGPTNSPDERRPMLILRQQGARADFRTVLEPLTGKPLAEKEVVELAGEGQ